jgi:tripartite-type tricarboxylate transporter receptor subunit TctC
LTSSALVSRLNEIIFIVRSQMPTERLPSRRQCLLAATALATPWPLRAQDGWPTRSITLVSPYPAGGITDLLCRIVGEELAKALGQSVVVENRTGASGGIAHASVAKAPPDGYTLIMGGSAPTAITPALNKSVSYGPKDFEPIGYVAELPIVLSTHPSVPGSTAAEFVAYVKANSGKLSCGHHGNGSSNQFACLTLARMTGTQIADVPYRGAPQVNTDLIANRVQIYFGTLPTQMPLAKDGKLKMFGITSPQRAPPRPSMPTLDEQGLTGLNFTSWNALYAPAGTPRPVIQRLSRELQKHPGLPEVRKPHRGHRLHHPPRHGRGAGPPDHGRTRQVQAHGRRGRHQDGMTFFERPRT